MKTAEEYAKKYNHIAGSISTDSMYDHSYYIFVDELREILTEHDAEIIALIDDDKWLEDYKLKAEAILEFEDNTVMRNLSKIILSLVKTQTELKELNK